MADLVSCPCRLNLGCYQVSTQDIKDSAEIERKCQLVNEAIHFLGPSNSQENCKILDKINELKERCGQYYFDDTKKLITIPNQVELPQAPYILKEFDDKKKKEIYLDKYCEDLLHQNLITALNNCQFNDAFIIKGFQSGDVLRAKIEKGKIARGKNLYAQLNKHEIEVQEILDIGEMDGISLSQCVEHHKNLKNNIITGSTSNWLFDKEYICLNIFIC